MPTKILMPALSPTMTEGNLAKWLKAEGDTVAAGDVIAEIETDKATMEVEAVDEGVLSKILVPAGSENIAINTTIAVLLEEDEDDAALQDFIDSLQKESAQGGAAQKETEQRESAPSTSNVPASASPSASPAPISAGPAAGRSELGSQPSMGASLASNAHGGRVFASPLAKRIAASEGINLASIEGSGPHGRIVKADLLNAASSAKGRVVRNSQEYTLQPNNNMRKVIAKRLLESKVTVPHFYLNIECQMDALLEARAQINAQFGDDKSKRVSVNDFVIMASAKALKDVPEANSSWTDEAIMLY